ncbi:MAG: UDP-glucose 4-epimerase GalE [Saprospiraceae bacterium]|jgi:UDP-glucose 4-epimerase|nr:UDP-glucose 4-epimerase GalE [Saprospiraceae bacterium]
MSRILVTGACGYIGSHTLVDLIQSGFEVVSIDNFTQSQPVVLEQVRQITGQRVQNFDVDLADKKTLFSILPELGKIDGIIHFAALKFVAESVEKPLEYYHNNINCMLHLLEMVNLLQIPYFIFSSSCTVYGNSNQLPVTEDSEFHATGSPYGRTKQMCEWILKDFCASQKNHFKAISLRYFNPAGAHPSILLGESPGSKAQNLIPAITETAIGIRPEIIVHGTDYDTRDGSCIRDYVHVSDLAKAHTLALQFAMRGNQIQTLEVFNLGMGQGVSVLEAIHAFEHETGIKLPIFYGPRRAGDLPAIYADIHKVKTLLHWSPELNIKDIMRTAWLWEQKKKSVI